MYSSNSTSVGGIGAVVVQKPATASIAQTLAELKSSSTRIKIYYVLAPATSAAIALADTDIANDSAFIVNITYPIKTT